MNKTAKEKKLTKLYTKKHKERHIKENFNIIQGVIPMLPTAPSEEDGVNAA